MIAAFIVIGFCTGKSVEARGRDLQTRVHADFLITRKLP
jgi:hypothetical protein